MSKKKEKRYVWTERAERISAGKKKDGEPATYNGRPLTEGGKAETWERLGWIKEAV